MQNEKAISSFGGCLVYKSGLRSFVKSMHFRVQNMVLQVPNNHFHKPKNYEMVFRFERFPLLDGFLVNFKRGTFWTKICHFFLEDGPPNKHGNPWAA